MIFDKMENISAHFDEVPLLKQVAAFMKEFEAKDLPDGQYTIDGARVFANIQSYRTAPQTAENHFEAHKKYMDVQYIVRGVEKIRWARLDRVTMVEERYSSGGDIAFYDGDAMLNFTLTAGTFLLLAPQDAHMPGLSAEKDVNVRKIVFKIQVDA